MRGAVINPQAAFDQPVIRSEAGEEDLVTDTAVTLALVEAGYGLALVTPLMTELRPIEPAIWKLRVASDREIIVLTRRSVSGRACGKAVQNALRTAFAALT